MEYIILSLTILLCFIDCKNYDNFIYSYSINKRNKLQHYYYAGVELLVATKFDYNYFDQVTEETYDDQLIICQQFIVIHLN